MAKVQKNIQKTEKSGKARTEKSTNKAEIKTILKVQNSVFTGVSNVKSTTSEKNTPTEKNTKKETIQKKQWSKYVTKSIALSLMNYNPKSELYKSYKNTSYCSDSILGDNKGKLTTTYCKNRWCLTCNRIKTAILINKYLPELNKLFSPVFLTLTVPTVKGTELPGRIQEMERSWRRLYRKSKKAKFTKNYGILKGIRKAECTIRPNNLYHYHYHLIVDGWACAEWILAEWLRDFPQANKKAQDIRQADEYSSKELFKYAFKSEVKPSNTNAKRYDLVFRALKGKRTIQPFGGIKAVKEDFDETDLVNQLEVQEHANKLFKWSFDDWYDKSTGEALVGLEIPLKVKKMANYND